MNWQRTVFLHTGWTSRYDGSEAPEGSHAYLRTAIGVENRNFLAEQGWCYGYAPVGRTSEGRQVTGIPVGSRSLNISKLGAALHERTIAGITVVWTAKHPDGGPTIVGLYENAVVYRYMPPDSEKSRAFVTRAPATCCRLVPERKRDFRVIRGRKGFPGMAAAWFPGDHDAGPVHDFLTDVADYLDRVRQYPPVETT